MIPIYRDCRETGQLSKLTPSMVRKRIEEGYGTMDYEEFTRLQKLLSLEAKLKTLKLQDLEWRKERAKS